MSNTVLNNKSNKTTTRKDKSKSLIDSLLEYEAVVVFGGLGCAIIGTIILTGMFQTGPGQRDYVLFNALGALLMGVGFIYIILTFMGAKVNILGTELDVGMIIYVVIVLFVMFVFGN